MENGAGSYRRFLDGDETGMVEIIQGYRDGLMLYLNRYVQNIHLAEELTEDTFVKLAVDRPRFGEKSSFKTWLYAIGKHLAADALRDRAKQGVMLPLEEVEELICAEEDVVRSYLLDEQKCALHRALRQLNAEYAGVLYLLYFEDFTRKEAGRVLKKSSRQLRNLIYRAKGALRAELDKEGFVYEEL